MTGIAKLDGTEIENQEAYLRILKSGDISKLDLTIEEKQWLEKYIKQEERKLKIMKLKNFFKLK